jgi:hypothetical protein
MPPNTRLLRIASSDKVDALSESNSKFTVSLNETLNVQQVKGYSVLSVSFPNVFHNVSDTDLTNRLSIVTDNGTDGPIEWLITLPDGFYNIDDLSAALKAAIDPIIAPDSISIDMKSTVDSRLVFTVTGATTISYTTEQGNMHKVLGITQDSTFQPSYTCDEMPQLQGTTNAYLHSRVLGQGNLLDAEGSVYSTICSIPIRAEYGFWTHWESGDEDLYSVAFASPRNLQSINIVLRGLDGRVLDIRNNELIIVLRLFY